MNEDHVSLAPDAEISPWVADEIASAPAVPLAGTDVAAALAWAVGVGRRAPSVGTGDTPSVWALLASLAALDVSLARIVEPHLDAVSILREAGTDLEQGVDPWHVSDIGADLDSSWGVFAAESAGSRLEARATGAGWVLSGTKPWCSLAAHLSHALVTAHGDSHQRRLFAVDLRAAGVRPHTGPWSARGLADIVSAPVDFTDVPAVPVGDAGWYLTRPGFAWGSMSVAACWWGAAGGVLRALDESAQAPRADQLAHVHAGRADAALWAARAVLAEAAEVADGRRAVRGDARLLTARVRAVVADAAALTLAEADAALGPAPLVTDERYARRVADLHLYLRQHHGLRDSARIGRLRAEAALAEKAMADTAMEE